MSPAIMSPAYSFLFIPKPAKTALEWFGMVGVAFLTAFLRGTDLDFFLADPFSFGVTTFFLVDFFLVEVFLVGVFFLVGVLVRF